MKFLNGREEELDLFEKAKAVANDFGVWVKNHDLRWHFEKYVLDLGGFTLEYRECNASTDGELIFVYRSGNFDSKVFDVRDRNGLEIRAYNPEGNWVETIEDWYSKIKK